MDFEKFHGFEKRFMILKNILEFENVTNLKKCSQILKNSGIFKLFIISEKEHEFGKNMAI